VLQVVGEEQQAGDEQARKQAGSEQYRIDKERIPELDTELSMLKEKVTSLQADTKDRDNAYALMDEVLVSLKDASGDAPAIEFSSIRQVGNTIYTKVR